MPRLLVIDDDPVLLLALSEMVRQAIYGVTVDIVDSPRSALAWIEVTDYDVIVCDIKMPEMDGLSLLTAIQNIRPGLPTILITGHGDCELAVSALRNGAYDFIQKPLDRSYFMQALKAAIQIRHLIRETSDGPPDLHEPGPTWKTSCRHPRVNCSRRRAT